MEPLGVGAARSRTAAKALSPRHHRLRPASRAPVHNTNDAGHRRQRRDCDRVLSRLVLVRRPVVPFAVVLVADRLRSCRCRLPLLSKPQQRVVATDLSGSGGDAVLVPRRCQEAPRSGAQSKHLEASWSPIRAVLHGLIRSACCSDAPSNRGDPACKVEGLATADQP